MNNNFESLSSIAVYGDDPCDYVDNNVVEIRTDLATIWNLYVSRSAFINRITEVANMYGLRVSMFNYSSTELLIRFERHENPVKPVIVPSTENTKFDAPIVVSDKKTPLPPHMGF